MIIHQVLATFANGEAVSNEALMIQKLLIKAGHISNIYALNIDDQVNGQVNKIVAHRNHLNRADHIIYHFFIGSPVMQQIIMLTKPNLIMRHHESASANYFSFFLPDLKTIMNVGRLKIRKNLHYFANILADSEFNKKYLIALGYPEDQIKIIPTLIDFDLYNRQGNAAMKLKMSDGKINILFAGRLTPNNCHMDLIKTVYYYGKMYNQNCRLIIAGSKQFPSYSELLANLILELGMGDSIYFTGPVKFDELLSIYQSANVFLSMSENEGFCVPVLESMHFNIPVIAYRSSTVAETVGEGGMLLDDKDFRVAAACINRVVTDSELTGQIIASQKKNLEKYKSEKVYNDLCNYIDELK